MTFGMILLIVIMVLSLAGSLIPQQETSMVYVQKYGPQAAVILIALGFTDLFHAWYFYALEILLCLNLLLCSILRFPRTRRAAFTFMASAEKKELETALTHQDVEKLHAHLQHRHWHRKDLEGRTIYFRHLYGFYGSFLTHLSILFVLLFGSLMLITPTVKDQTVMPGSSLMLEDGTEIFCESFHIEDSEGRLDYASLLRVVSPDGQQSRTQEIRVNQPLRFHSYKIYQQTYGTAGRVRIYNAANKAEETLYLTEPCFLSIDNRNGIYFESLFAGYLKDEEGNYTLIASTDRSYPDPVYQVQSISDGMSTSLLAFPDESLTFGDITFTFLSPAEYPGLRIKHVSTILPGFLYFSFAFMVIALYLCFFTVPVCIVVFPDGYTLVSGKPLESLKLELQLLLEGASKPSGPQ